jgi:hypothetical protein
VRQLSKILILLAFLFCGTAFSAGDSVPSEECERWFRAQGKRKGVMIVTHGLNLKPARMDGLAQFFSAQGYEVLRPSFTGHCGRPEELQQVKAESWEKDARHFYAKAKVKADYFKVPLYLTAYSFSGLIYQSMTKELPFKKRVFLASALETHFWYPIAIFLVNLWPTSFFRTWIPDGYFAQEYGGFRSVLAMNHFFLKWNDGRKSEDKTPTLVWGDPKDELVNVPKLKLLAEGSPGWEFRELGIGGCALPKCYHHLIVDEAALGPAEWKRVTETSAIFLGQK